MSDTQEKGDCMRKPNSSTPGGPGISARWTSSAKTGIGTALSNKSRVWFTLSHGIFNEIYYPRIDQACVRDMGLGMRQSRWPKRCSLFMTAESFRAADHLRRIQAEAQTIVNDALATGAAQGMA